MASNAGAQSYPLPDGLDPEVYSVVERTDGTWQLVAGDWPLYRFGGEEFVVLMRCADGEAAAHAFERLRGNVERHVFPQVGQMVAVRITDALPHSLRGEVLVGETAVAA